MQARAMVAIVTLALSTSGIRYNTGAEQCSPVGTCGALGRDVCAQACALGGVLRLGREARLIGGMPVN